MKQNQWLFAVHPLYEEREAEWLVCERRFRGGTGVLEELSRFEWERAGTTVGSAKAGNERALQDAVERSIAREGVVRTHYQARQSTATYVSFPHAFASMLVGHLMRRAPEADNALNFGGLGRVTREDPLATPTRAELVYFNTDGVGNDGSQWDNFWTEVSQWSLATGHRWVMVEAPAQRPATLADEIRGQRPFLTSYSPLAVTNWLHLDGRLQFAVLRIAIRSPRRDGDALTGNEIKEGRRLLVRRGFADLGPEYQRGGWWDFDADGAPIIGRHGEWENTQGEIPAWIHYGARDRDKLSRSLTFEIGQAAVAVMNLSSAADFDAWDAASSMTWLSGVDSEGWNLAMDKIREGSRFVPLKSTSVGLDKVVTPTVHDGSTGAVVAGVFDSRIASALATVRELAAREVSGAPDSSGKSKQVGFLDAKSPRLRSLASEVEASQNTALRFLELRFGVGRPSAAVKWPREFDLAPLLDQINGFLDSQERAGARSPVLTARAVLIAAEQAGLVNDNDDREALLKELQDLVISAGEGQARERSFMAGFTRLPAGGDQGADGDA